MKRAPALTVACILSKSAWQAVALSSALIVLLLAPLAALHATEIPISEKAHNPFPNAIWIGIPAARDTKPVVDVRDAFRHGFALDQKPVKASVRITADARYILWVNGMFVGRRPARGFPWAQPYDEFDLAPFLQPGRNWIAAEVYQFGPGQGAFGLGTRGNGVYVSTGRSGLLIEGEAVLPNASVVPIRTDPACEARRAEWHVSVASPYLHGCFGFQECVDARREPSGWRVGQGADGWQKVSQLAAPRDATWTGYEPRPGGLQWAKGVVPTPHGNIRLSWKRAADGVIEADLEAPKGVLLRATNAMVRVTHQTASTSDAPAERLFPQAAEARKSSAKALVPKDLVVTGQWTEFWPDAGGKAQPREVKGEIWNASIQAALDTNNAVHLPKRDQPYYLDGPIVLKSGQKLTADPGAEIRLKPGCNTCMVRNEHVVTLNTKPVPADLKLDTDITIQGGIWTTLATAVASHGNERGHSSKENPAFGTHGVILLQNVRRVSVKNVTIRQSRPFGVHLANAHEFTVENITLEEHRRDGVHVNGPASDGVIRGVRGDSHDDNVALNAWEWKNYAPSYGPIERIVIEDVTGSPEGLPAANAIRILPGVKRFDDGTTLDCPVRDITLRRITDIREFKFYDQPNLELGRDKDFSPRIGTLKNIRLENLTFHTPGKIEVHADTDGLAIDNVNIHHPLAPDWHLLAIGPKSVTYQGRPGTDPARWTEIFSPDLDCTVRNVVITGVRAHNSQTDLPIEQVVQVIEQKPNPDYPKTTPKGGTGKGVWIR